MNYAWPSAEIAVMGAKGAAGNTLSEKRLMREIIQRLNCGRKEAEYSGSFANPYRAAYAAMWMM